MLEHGNVIGLESPLFGKLLEKEYESEDEAEEADLSDDDSDNGFNLLFGVLVTETETNEIDDEFNEALTEIEGKIYIVQV